jgi:hypothetical protein
MTEEPSQFEVFWQTYPADLCNRKGSRQEAEKKWNKIDAETQGQIIINMRELMRVDRKVKKSGAGRAEWVWPMATTWLNQARWEDIADIKQSADMPTDSRKCDCGADAEITDKCWRCYGQNNPIDNWGLKDIFIKNGLLHEESKAERAERCKDFLRQRGYLGKVIPDRA